ncbi:hypothetical protein MHYP_G00192080 [Metynnis hypsauchen]
MKLESLRRSSCTWTGTAVPGQGGPEQRPCSTSGSGHQAGRVAPDAKVRSGCHHRQLYGLFMAKLSACIFEWDAADVVHLREAVQAEMEEKQGVVGLSKDQLNSKLRAKLLTRHCRRRTCGAEETEELVRQLLEAFCDVKDTMGIPLLDNEKRVVIWNTQQQHLRCIQDRSGLQLYAKRSQLTKGGVFLLVYHCVQGSMSLKSFHQHLNKFIPAECALVECLCVFVMCHVCRRLPTCFFCFTGTSANAENFQAYLLEGLARWNEGPGSRRGRPGRAGAVVLQWPPAAQPQPAQPTAAQSQAG